MEIFALIVEMLPGNETVPNALRYDVVIEEMFAVEIEASVAVMDDVVSIDDTKAVEKLLIIGAVAIVE